jgi:glycerol kinase
VGLGAPHWVPEARGVLFGLTRGTTAADVGRATLEGVAYQVADLIEAAAMDCRSAAAAPQRATPPGSGGGPDAGQPLRSLRVDGGMARNAWFLQCQADVLGLPVLQSPHSEATAQGAAYLAGLQAGVWPDLASLRRLAAEARTFEPRLAGPERQARLRRWRRAVQAVIAFYTASE